MKKFDKNLLTWQKNLIFQILNVKKVGIGRKNCLDVKHPGHLKSFHCVNVHHFNNPKVPCSPALFSSQNTKKKIK